jgi:hypothetical protein
VILFLDRRKSESNSCQDGRQPKSSYHEKRTSLFILDCIPSVYRFSQHQTGRGHHRSHKWLCIIIPRMGDQIQKGFWETNSLSNRFPWLVKYPILLRRGISGIIRRVLFHLGLYEQANHNAINVEDYFARTQCLVPCFCYIGSANGTSINQKFMNDKGNFPGKLTYVNRSKIASFLS